jgi:enediyne biosynthesis protein E4
LTCMSLYLDPTQMLQEQKKCAWRGLEVYCGPPGMRGASDVLYRNNGDGTFSNASQRAGVEDRDRLFGFTVSFDDFDNDGRLDIFVANDRGRNYLYQNLGQGKFKEIGEAAGAAYPADGRPQANMGVAIGDYDRNGAMDIFVTTFADESFTLYKNTGRGSFVEVSAEARLTVPTLPFLGWGTFFADLDNDGRLDLLTANGHVYPEVDRVPRFKQGFAQRPLLFRQSDAGVFAEIALTSGMAGLKHWSSRGAAYADFDNDGDIDVTYTHFGAPPTLMENVIASPNRWITIKTVGTKSNRDGIGARLKVKSGDQVQFATVRSGESYLSGNDPRIHIGLGAGRKVDELEIRWPSGQIDRISDIPSNQRITVQEGKGIVQASAPAK